MSEDALELKRRYDDLARTLDHRTTACDYNLRELEIDTAVEYMRDGQRILDVGCGLGYALTQYAARKRVEAHGIDYSDEMIASAKQLFHQSSPDLRGTVTFRQADVSALPYDGAYFDVVTSSRCLMALLDWELQKKALIDIARVLKPGGMLVLMEGTFDGLDKLNQARNIFGLPSIDAGGRDRLFTLKFHERELLDFCKPLFINEWIKRFGMYYFLTRVVHPLLVAPDSPKYEHKINEVARQIARLIPDFEGMGHLVAFGFVKRLT